MAKPTVDSDTHSPHGFDYRALLDTGATISAISPNVVDSLGVKADGWRDVTGVHGTTDTATYTVSIVVPIEEDVAGPDDEGTYTFFRGANLEVASLSFQPASFDVLLGMDILEDFHLTTYRDLFILSN